VEQHIETIQPMGRNSMKHKKEEEKILEAASQRLKSSTASVPSHQLTNILEQIAVSVGSALTTWTLHQALAYCSEDVQHQYNDLVFKQQIDKFMANNATARRSHTSVTPLQLTNSLNSVSTKSTLDDMLSSEVAGDRDDSDSIKSEVPCSLVH
jgi:hypothetical protein